MIMVSKSIHPSEIGNDDECIVTDVRESDEFLRVILKIQSISN